MRFSHQEFFMCGFGLAFLHQPNNIKAVKMIPIGFVNDLKFFSFYYNDVINLRVNSFELWEMMQHSCSGGYQTFLMSFSLLSCPAMPCNHIRASLAPCIANATIPIQPVPWQPTLDQGRTIPFIPFHLASSFGKATQPFRNSVYNNDDGWEKPSERAPG